MEHTTPPIRLTRQTILEIIRRAPDSSQQAMIDNPNAFATAVVSIIKDQLADQLIEGFQYEKINTWYDMTQLRLRGVGYSGKCADNRLKSLSFGSRR